MLTLEQKGANAVEFKEVYKSLDKRFATLIVTACGDGDLHVDLIYRGQGKAQRKEFDSYDPSVKVFWQKNAWMDRAVMESYKNERFLGLANAVREKLQESHARAAAAQNNNDKDNDVDAHDNSDDGNSDDGVQEIMLLMDNLDAHFEEKIVAGLTLHGVVTWSGMPGGTGFWQVVDFCVGRLVRDEVEYIFYEKISAADFDHKTFSISKVRSVVCLFCVAWFRGFAHSLAVSARGALSQLRILLTRIVAEARDNLLNGTPAHPTPIAGTIIKAFFRTGCAMSADGSRDKEIAPVRFPPEYHRSLNWSSVSPLQRVALFLATGAFDRYIVRTSELCVRIVDETTLTEHGGELLSSAVVRVIDETVLAVDGNRVERDDGDDDDVGLDGEDEMGINKDNEGDESTSQPSRSARDQYYDKSQLYRPHSSRRRGCVHGCECERQARRERCGCFQRYGHCDEAVCACTNCLNPVGPGLDEEEDVAEQF